MRFVVAIGFLGVEGKVANQRKAIMTQARINEVNSQTLRSCTPNVMFLSNIEFKISETYHFKDKPALLFTDVTRWRFD